MLHRNLIQLKQSSLQLSDEELIKHYLLTQHSTYFNQLYRKYSVKIYAKCLYLLKEENIARDAMQDIFIKIFSNLYRFENKSKFSTWVYSITYNYCIDVIRKKKKENRFFFNESEQLEDYLDKIEDTTYLETKVEHLRQILENIPKRDKKVLLMKYQNEMPIKEIANTLNITESAIKMRIKRAKTRAKKMYTNSIKSKNSTSDTIDYTNSDISNNLIPYQKMIPSNQ